jgi:predicted DCC family thiol-disulfide oxidoreductase YuxK
MCFLYSLQNHQIQIIGITDFGPLSLEDSVFPNRGMLEPDHRVPSTTSPEDTAQHLSLCQNITTVYARVMNEPVIVLFDGVCNLCNGVVQFVIARDPQARFKFASQQSQAGIELMRLHHLPEMTSVVLIRDGKALLKSDAVLEIARLLPAPWTWAAAFKFVPRVVRDFVYDLVARSRYSIFGRRDACWLPTPELRTRFLDT